MENKNFDFKIKSTDHAFDLWFFEQLLDEVVRLNHIQKFHDLINENPDLANEYFKKHIENIEKAEVPSEFIKEEWAEKILSRIHQIIESKKEKD